MKEWLKQHWKVLAAVGAGAIGLYLLWQRSQSAGGGAPAAADTGSGLPSTGPPPASSGAPPQFLNAGEQAAAALAASQAQTAYAGQALSLGEQNALANQQAAAFFSANPISGAKPTGVVQQKWAQFVDAGQTIWEDKSGKNRAPITEQQAELSAQMPKGEGPYYQSKGGTGPLGWVEKNIVPIFKTAVRVFNAASAAQPGSEQTTPPMGTSASLYPGPQFVGPPAPSTGPEQTAMVARAPRHIPGPTTPHGIPNHAVGVH